MVLKNKKTPVLLIIYNRNEALQVVSAVREYQPDKIYIAADGPRQEKSGDDVQVKEIRQNVLKQIDWYCNVSTLFREKNMGCKKAVGTAISWFFENEKEGIILEDDCVPVPCFFKFCTTLLEKYRHDTRVLHIGGTNPLNTSGTSDSYYFSKYNRIWGWATWRRAWNYYDEEISFWPEIKDKKILFNIFSTKEATYWTGVFDAVYSGMIDTWDYQWFLCRLLQGKAVIAGVNLVKNIGFNSEGTHTSYTNNKFGAMGTGSLQLPLKHPKYFVEDYKKDALWGKIVAKAFFQKVAGKLRRVIRK